MTIAATAAGFIMSWISAGVPGGMDEGRISGIKKVAGISPNRQLAPRT